MLSISKALLFLSLLITFAGLKAQVGKTTRYWDCCKPSCSWSNKTPFSKPVNSCSKDGRILGADTRSGCDGGTAYVCTNNQPWAINDHLAYGFAAASLKGKSEWDTCCSCYKLTFSSGPARGKKMVVQVVNTGADLGENHFDLQIPGAGVGIFNGCQSQWGAPSNGWGQRYGGVASARDCSQLPRQLQNGCKFRFAWFKGSDNPGVSFVKVQCPAALTSKSGCKRTNE